MNLFKRKFNPVGKRVVYKGKMYFVLNETSTSYMIDTYNWDERKTQNVYAVEVAKHECQFTKFN